MNPTALLLGLAWLVNQPAAVSRDPSPHQIRFVTVDSSVRLEVLDWGGAGRPLLFVGCYLTAHVYDDIAPKLTDQFHVLRRDAKRHRRVWIYPVTGYDPQRRADDILEVIDMLGIQKLILIGNACGGAILHTLGAQYPERLGGLVYLDAADDPTLTMADYGVPPFDPAKLPPRADSPTAVIFPEAEQRQMQEWPLDPAIRKAITEDNNVRPDYARIRVPVMAIYRTVTMEQALKEFPPRDDLERANLNQLYASGRAMTSKWQRDLLAGLPTARIVELPGANLFMFLTNEADVIREVRTFGASLK